MTAGGRSTSDKSRFMRRLEAGYRPPPGMVFLEDIGMLVRLPLVNGVMVVANCVLLSTLLFVNAETAVGWTVVGLGVVYVLAICVFLITVDVGLYIHLVLWASLVQNVAAHVMLGGFVWSGAILFWGIILSVAAALFLGRWPWRVIAGSYALAAVVLGLLEPVLQARRSQPALVVSVGQAVDVFVISIAIMVPIVIALMNQVAAERGRSERLLLNVLPRPIASRLKHGEEVIADAHDSCTVLFADLVGFTDHTTRVSPETLIEELNLVFSLFDRLVDACGAEKIKTMGDGYLAVAGAPNPDPNHARVICELALRMQEATQQMNAESGSPSQLRIGVATGPLIAGVVGTARFSYDLWGETVNLASRMQTMCPPGTINVTDTVAIAAGDAYVFEPRGASEVKGVGPVITCLLTGRKSVDSPPSPVAEIH